VPELWKVNTVLPGAEGGLDAATLEPVNVPEYDGVGMASMATPDPPAAPEIVGDPTT
jgi:hypothetical protein